MRLLVAILMTSISSSVFAERPNIVLIMCDDLGYSDVGFNGATDIVTPELDKLAKNGTVFSSAYVVHPFCGPSRMGLMTGRYPHEFGAPFNLPEKGDDYEEYYTEGVDVDEILISTVLQQSGYRTCAIGKWHMGIGEAFHPNRRGFDDYYGFLGGGHKYFPEQFHKAYRRQLANGVEHIWAYLTPLEHNGTEVEETEYITDALSREAVRFVHESAKVDQPFFLYLAYNAPHTPLEAKQEDMQLFQGIKDKKRRTYAGMVYAVDRGVGKVVDALKSTSELDNTLIVFVSDNGGKLVAGATNRPLREGKGSVYEGGSRVPMFFHWPNQVPAGKKYVHPVSALDFYPTFAGLAEAAIPADKHLDGKDIWKDFQADQSPRKGKAIYTVRHRNGYTDVSARRDQWKICRAYQQSWKLYDIENDISEQQDLGSQHPEILHSLVSEVEQWSHTHTKPRWFHALEARDEWIRTDMPNYKETFSIQ